MAQRRFQYNIRSLLLLQLKLAPIGLAIPYSSANARPIADPMLGLVWYVAPALGYTALLTLLWLRRAQPKSHVLAGAKRGARFGLLFGALAWSWLALTQLFAGLLFLVEMIQRIFSWGPAPITADMWRALFEFSAVLAGLVGFWAIHYLVIGAAGGVSAGCLSSLLGVRRVASAETVSADPTMSPFAKG